MGEGLGIMHGGGGGEWMVDGIIEAAVSTYSFIIQSNVSLCLIIYPLTSPTKSDKPKPLIHAASFPQIYCFFRFHFNFIWSLLLSCNLAKVEEERCVFLLSSRSCLNIDRDWKHRRLLSHIWEGQGWQSFRADFIRGAEDCKYRGMWITSPCRLPTSLHYSPACLTPWNIFQWSWRLEGDGVKNSMCKKPTFFYQEQPPTLSARSPLAEEQRIGCANGPVD